MADLNLNGTPDDPQFDILTAEELEYAEILSNPAKWAAMMFGWEARDYQYPVLELAPEIKQLVLRLGRRLGKTEMMCILILWYGFTQINMGPNKQYDILILTPFEAQIDLIFERLHELIDLSPEIKASIRRDITYQIEFKNGTVIRGMTVGSKSGSGAANTRGQRADVIILDEVDYMGPDDITNVINIRNEDPTRIRIIAASTPSGARMKYYEWCTRSSRDFQAETDANGIGFIKYHLTERKGRAGNGWTHFYAPSTVNKKLLEINPETGITYLEDLQEELTEMRYAQEVMAEFGEEEMGVFQKRFIDAAVDLGKSMGTVYHMRDFERVGPRILAIDWDKYGASTNMVGMHMDEHRKVMEPFVRREIPKGDFTFDNGVKAIIELNDIYNFDWIYVDSGHGEYQIETLRKYGMANPRSGLDKKVVRVNFSEKISIMDPHTRRMEKKDIKPFMVNNAVVAFERGHIALNPTDKKMIKQFEDYRVERIGANGRPVFTEVNEHIVDCVNMCIHGFNQKYGDMMKTYFSTKMHGLRRKNAEPEDVAVPSRTEAIQTRQEEFNRSVGTTMMRSVSNNSIGRSRLTGGGRGGGPFRSRF